MTTVSRQRFAQTEATIALAIALLASIGAVFVPLVPDATGEDGQFPLSGWFAGTAAIAGSIAALLAVACRVAAPKQLHHPDPRVHLHVKRIRRHSTAAIALGAAIDLSMLGKLAHKFYTEFS